MPTAEQKDPPEFDKKINFLQRHKVPRQILGHVGTQVALASALGLPRETFRDRLSKRELDSNTQSLLARKLAFRLDWPEWASGTAEAFERRYLGEHLKVPEKAHVRLKSVPQTPERCKVRGLASIELFTGQVGYGDAAVGFELSCGKGFILGLPITIRVGEISLDCGGGQLDPLSRQGRAAPYQIGDVQLRWNGADTFQPAWRVDAEGVSIGNLDAPPDFGRIVGLTPGTWITLAFGVWRPDIEEDNLANSDAIVEAFDAISVPYDERGENDTSNLTVIKRRVLMRLATEALECHGDFIVIAKHAVTFEANEEEVES